MKRINRIQLRSAGIKPNAPRQEKSEFLPRKSEREIPSAKRPEPRPHRCLNLTPNRRDGEPEITEASDLKVKASECRRKAKEDVWEEGGRVCSLQEVAVKTPSAVVTVQHFGDAVTTNADFVEPGVRIYKRNVSKYTYKSKFPASKTSVGGAGRSKSIASTRILSRPPLICDCILNPQPSSTTVKTLPNVIVKDSANFAKFRHDISEDEQHVRNNVSAGTPRKISELLTAPRNSHSKMSDRNLRRLVSSSSLFSAEPSKNGFSVSKSKLSRVAESSSKFSSKASSERPIIQEISGQGDTLKLNDGQVLKRIVYRAEGVLHDGKSATPRMSSAKSKILPIRKVPTPRTIQTF